jgi:hypothetical protein
MSDHREVLKWVLDFHKTYPKARKEWVSTEYEAAHALLEENERLRKEVPTAGQEIWRAKANEETRKIEAALALYHPPLAMVKDCGGCLALTDLIERVKALRGEERRRNELHC